MKLITKEQFYSDRKKTTPPTDSGKGYYATALSEVLFDNLYPIDQFFMLLCSDEPKDESDLERAIHILRSMVEKLSNDLWKFDTEVTKHLGDIFIHRPRSSWESEQRGMAPIGVKVCRLWFADDDNEEQGSEGVEIEETSEQVRELFGE